MFLDTVARSPRKVNLFMRSKASLGLAPKPEDVREPVMVLEVVVVKIEEGVTVRDDEKVDREF